MKKVKILVADDHTIVCTGLTALLKTVSDFSVVGSAKDGAEAIALAVERQPDVVVMDILMPVMDGVEATQRIREKAPHVQVLVLTSVGTAESIARALEAGAIGAVMKDAPNESLIEAIRSVARGERAVAEDIQNMMDSEPPLPELTPRQQDVLLSMARGLSNKDISKQLSICEDRVKQHRDAIFSKLGAANRTEAVAIALRKHLLKI